MGELQDQVPWRVVQTTLLECSQSLQQGMESFMFIESFRYINEFNVKLISNNFRYRIILIEK